MHYCLNVLNTFTCFNIILILHTGNASIQFLQIFPQTSTRKFSFNTYTSNYMYKIVPLNREIPNQT